MRSKKILLCIVTGMALVTGFSSAINISSCDDLANINNNVNTGYTLTQDIDCSASGNSIMIHGGGIPFAGSFDGQGHTITLNINSSENYIGLFRSMRNASISNLTLSGSVICTFSDLEGEGYVGALAAIAENTTIDNVHSSAYVESSIYEVGGLIGMASIVTMTDSSTSAHVIGTGNLASNIGGLIGRAQNNSVISGSYALGNVHAGYARAGGLVGIMTDSTIHRSYAAGDISANNGAGGLVGWSFGSTITDTYAVGDINVEGGESAGLIGFVDSTHITNSYSAADVNGNGDHIGGLIGQTQGGGNLATDSYWDMETSDRHTSVLGEGKSTAEMTDIDTFTGWDFETIWGMSGSLNHGYPYLLAIPPVPGDTTNPDTFISSATSDAVDSSGVTFEFLANEESATFECSIDDGITIEDFVTCTSPYIRSGLTPGAYTFYVRARDAAHNLDESPASRTWTIGNSVGILGVSPTDGSTNISTDTTIVVRFAEPVSFPITIGSGPCDGSGGICPQLDGVWSSGNTVLTYTRADEDFHNNTTYSIQLTENNGLVWHQIYSGSFTTAQAHSTNNNGGGGGGGLSKDICSDDSSISYYDRTCGDIVSNWKKFFAKFGSGAVSSVGNVITVKSFVTDVFTLLHITKPVHRQTDSDTKIVPEQLVMKIIQVLRKLLHK